MVGQTPECSVLMIVALSTDLVFAATSWISWPTA